MTDKTEWNYAANEQDSLITVGGEIDYTVSQELRNKFSEFIEASSGDVKLDLDGLKYLDSSGLAVLIELRRNLKGVDRGLAIVKIQPQVEKIFRLTQVSVLFGL